jgi:hypothetical protein
MPQTVRILNSGTIGATISGDPGFWPPQIVQDLHGDLKRVVKDSSAMFILEAHHITLVQIKMPLVEPVAGMQYYPQLGPVSADYDKGIVDVEVNFELKDLSSGETVHGEALFRCN